MHAWYVGLKRETQIQNVVSGAADVVLKSMVLVLKHTFQCKRLVADVVLKSMVLLLKQSQCKRLVTSSIIFIVLTTKIVEKK